MVDSFLSVGFFVRTKSHTCKELCHIWKQSKKRTICEEEVIETTQGQNSHPFPDVTELLCYSDNSFMFTLLFSQSRAAPV